MAAGGSSSATRYGFEHDGNLAGRGGGLHTPVPWLAIHLVRRANCDHNTQIARAYHRQISTGVLLCVSTFTATLPSSTRLTPR